MIDRISDTAKTKGKNKVQTLSAATSKVIQEIEDELVDYEPWMDANGTQPNGIEFDVDDPKVAKNPALWLDATEIREILQAETDFEEKNAKLVAKKEEKKTSKKKKAALNTKKKGVAPIKSATPMDNVLEEPVFTVNDVELDIAAIDNLDLSDNSMFGFDSEDELYREML
jgi:hypothetical protein